MEFPRTVYVKGPGMEVVGGTLTPMLVLDELEYHAALEAGYFPSVPEALAEKLDEPIPEVKADAEVKAEEAEVEAEAEVKVEKKKKALKLSTPPVYE